MAEYFSEKEIEKNEDPFEPLNRFIFNFNKFSYDYFLKYIVDAYSLITPDFLERGFINFFHNLQKPYIILNSLLKLDPANAGIVFSTFIINSSFGLFGFFDLTAKDSIKYQNIDLDNVLEFYKFPRGPYLTLPLLGPSSLRGVAALGLSMALRNVTVDYYTNNKSISLHNRDYMSYIILKNLVSIDRASDYIEDIYNNSLDPYSTIKSYYLQHK
jgi:phospholipid-binding lipoprotein MlaA